MLKDEWIRCSDKMPKVGEVCLFYITYPPGTMFNCRADTFPKQNMRLGGLNWEKKWVCYERQYDGEISNVTNWMPLPPIPKKEKENVDSLL